jgi:hypothetical protein
MRLKIASLGLIPTGSSDHDIIEHHSIRRVAQLLKDFRPSKPPGDARQRVQLRLLIFFWQQQQTDQVDRLAIDGVEIYRLSQSRHYSERMFHLLQPHVRNRHPIADAGRSESSRFGRAWKTISSSTFSTRAARRARSRSNAVLSCTERSVTVSIIRQLCSKSMV